MFFHAKIIFDSKNILQSFNEKLGHILSGRTDVAACPKIKLFAHEKIPNTKGQLISKCLFGVFKSPKKPTKFYQDFCPSF